MLQGSRETALRVRFVGTSRNPFRNSAQPRNSYLRGLEVQELYELVPGFESSDGCNSVMAFFHQSHAYILASRVRLRCAFMIEKHMNFPCALFF